MNGIIMDRKGSKIIIMKPDGTFINMKNTSSLSIGQEIKIVEDSMNFNAFYRYASIIAACILILIGGINVRAYYTPYGYMNIDINPSIKLDVNKFDRVIGAIGLNEDGMHILNNIDGIKNTRIEDATESIIEAAYNFEYIKNDDEGDVVVSLYSPDDSKRELIELKVNKSVNNYLQKKNVNANLIQQVVSKENLEAAKSQNVSVGKLIMIEKIKNSNPEISSAELNDMSMKDILKTVKENKKQQKQHEKLNKQDLKDEKNEKNRASEPNTPNAPVINKDSSSFESPTFEKPKIKKPELDKTFNNKNNFENKQAQVQNKADKIIAIPEQKAPNKNVNDRIKNIKEKVKNINKGK